MSELQESIKQAVGAVTEDAMPNQTCSEILERLHGLVAYLYRISRQAMITPEIALTALNAWNKLSQATGNALPVPDASPGPDGQLLHTWDRGEHHLELELLPEGISEFFYRNRSSGELWEHEYKEQEPLSESIGAKLSLFL